MTDPGTLRWFLQRVRERCYLDIGPGSATTFVAGMGRSGTTWVADLINQDSSYRILFEPLLSANLRGALGFEYIQFMDRNANAPAAERIMDRLLSGRIRMGPTDRDHRGVLFRRRIVKEIRCNLMLGWLRELRPAMPIVLVVRNPLAVAASWLRLGWTGPETPGDLDVLLAQPALLEAAPMLSNVARRIDRADPFERVILQWCILHLVPMQQLKPGELLFMRYESLITDPDAELDRLAGYLGVSMDPKRRARVVSRFASTNLLGRGARSTEALLNDWRSHLNAAQVSRAQDILDMCGLDADHVQAAWPVEK